MNRSIVLGMSLESFDNYQQYREYENPQDDNKDYFINQSTECKPDYETFIGAINDRWGKDLDNERGQELYKSFCQTAMDMHDYIEDLRLDEIEENK